MTFRKGSRPHRVVGNVFFISMLSMAAAGASMAFMKSQMNNVFGGILTFYLVATAWVTARRREREIGIFDWGTLMVALAMGAGIISYVFKAANTPTGTKGGVPTVMYFFLGSVALIAAAGDLRMIRRGTLSGASRIARHLWRMCFGLFIATVSIFIARPHLFPVFLSN